MSRRSRTIPVVEGQTVELFRLTPSTRDMFIAIHRTGKWPRGPGRVVARRALARGWIALGTLSNRYRLTEAGRARAIAYVSCACGWRKFDRDIDRQEEFDKLLADHKRVSREETCRW